MTKKKFLRRVRNKSPMLKTGLEIMLSKNCEVIVTTISTLVFERERADAVLVPSFNPKSRSKGTMTIAGHFNFTDRYIV